MAYLSWNVKFGSGFGSSLNDVLTVDTEHGRDWPTDPFNPASCTIVSRNIAAWTTKPVIGDIIYVSSATDRNVAVFSGFIKDVQINYGTKASMDTAVITCEGPLAQPGRKQINSVAITQNTTLVQISAVMTAYFSAYGQIVGTGKSIASAQTYTGNLLDLINLLLTTEMGYAREIGVGTFIIGGDYKYNPQVNFYPRNYDTTASYTFSDNPASNSEMRYDPTGIAFTSAAQLYYRQATIQPQGLASQTSGTSNYSIIQDSLDYNTSQALSHAQYIVSQYASTTSRPLSITASYAQQTDNATRMTTYLNFLADTNSGAGNLIKIVFRGNTYYAVIEGRSLFADTSETSVTVTVSGYDNNNYLILNNAVFGTLGTSGTYPGNKLGF